MPATNWQFVGRDAELAQLTAMLVAARPGIAVVDGELGVGKTRLLHEAVARARAHGIAVRRGAGHIPGSDRAALVVDDLQWADRTSLELVESLVNDPPAVVLLGCRRGLFPAALRAPVERNAGHWLRLGPLSATDVDRLLGDESPARRRALHVASGGNPRYLGILAGAPQDVLVEPGQLDERVADALDQVITSELRTFDHAQRAVLHAAAVLGDNIDLDLVAEVARLDAVAAAHAVDELAMAGLLTEGDGRLRFVHPLVLAAAHRLAGPGARVLAHRRAAECLCRRGAGVTRQAHHVEHAAELGDTAAAEVLAEAAKVALGSAPATSVRWLRVALRVLPQQPEQVDHRSRLRVLLAKALVAAGHLDAGRAELGDLRGLTGPARPAAVRLLAVIARLLGDLPAARGLVSAELRRTGVLELRFELLTAELLAGRWSHAARSADALDAESARRHPGLPAAAASLRTLCAVPGRLTDLVERLRWAEELVDGLDDGTLCDVLDVTVPLGWVQLLVDNDAAALRHVDRGLTLANRNGQRHVIAQLHPIRVLAHCRNGSIAESLRAADDAVAAARAVGSPEMITFAQLLRLRPLWLREGPGAAGRAVDEMAVAPLLGSTWHRMIADAQAAEVLLALDRAEECRARLQPWLVGAAPAMSALAPGWCALLSQAYLAAGDLPGARRWLDAATARIDDAIRLGDTPLTGQLAAVAHADAAVLLAEDRAGAAAARAGVAADRYASVGFLVRAAEAKMTLAEALLRDGRVAHARHELGDSRAMLADAGADWLAAVAGRAQRRAGARLPRPAPRTGLTSREREIAELVAQGMTNRAIADILYLSPRTVDAHLRRILTKLEVPNRAAVVRRLGQDRATQD